VISTRQNLFSFQSVNKSVNRRDKKSPWKMASTGFYGADDGNRTRVASLEGWSSAIELHLHTGSACTEAKLLNTRLLYCEKGFSVKGQVQPVSGGKNLFLAL
jgi:hypothetical protein